MIECTINGQTAFPSVKENIKITLENAMLKDRDAWSMEIEFPMEIEANARIFGNANFLQVARSVRKYDDCALRVDNQEVIRGVGIVTNVTEKEVKLQIKSGIQKVNVLSDAERIYIDSIQYDETVILPDPSFESSSNPESYTEELFRRMQTGMKSQYVVIPIYDINNDEVINNPKIFYNVTAGGYYYPYVFFLRKFALQPNLGWVFRKVMRRMGYETEWQGATEDNALDLMDRIFIANTRDTRTLERHMVVRNYTMKECLPHWSVKTFLEEVRKLLNITIVFDEARGLAKLLRNDPFKAETVEYTCLDEITTTYEEGGKDYIGSSNLRYNLAESDCRLCDDISDEVLRAFEVREYNNLSELQYACDNMGDDERKRIIFHCPKGHYYYAHQDDWSGLRKATFQHLTRDEEGDEVTLNIAPVAIYWKDVDIEFHWPSTWTEWETIPAMERTETFTGRLLPCVAAEENPELTVQEVVEGGGSATRREAERMEVFMLGETDNEIFWGDSTHIPYAQATTDPDRNYNTETQWSFALSGTTAAHSIGDLHPKEKVIEDREPVVIKFPCNGKPDPTKIYLFRNKKYLCDKIEMDIEDGQVSLIKTGYFYELS